MRQVLVAGLQCVPEGKNISDLQQIKMMDLGAGDSVRANYVPATPYLPTPAHSRHRIIIFSGVPQPSIIARFVLST